MRSRLGVYPDSVGVSSVKREGSVKACESRRSSALALIDTCICGAARPALVCLSVPCLCARRPAAKKK